MLMIIFAAIFCFLLGIFLIRALHPYLSRPINQEKSSSTSANSCGVCGDPYCLRQKSSGDHTPWAGLEVPEEIDRALQDLFNGLLKEFIEDWYGTITKDESFLWEIRQRLRFACSILLRRILKMNMGEIICERLVPLYLRHVDDFATSDGCSSEAEKVKTVVLHLGDRLHPAARSRKNELEYLRAVSRSLVNIGVPSEDTKCRPLFLLVVELLAGWALLPLSDTLCSPYIINTLIYLAVSPGRSPVPVLSDTKVQFLKAFATKPFTYSVSSPLRPNLRTILKDPKYLYPLIQYMKKIGCVNLVQFCLDVEDFNTRLLVPEIMPTDAQALHNEASQLYKRYLQPYATDRIQCSPGVAELFALVLSRSVEDITRLQTSTPLFQAYEEAFCLIEQKYLPGFFQSELHFELLCSRRRPLTPKRMQQPRSKEPLVTKLSHKLQKFVAGTTESGLTVDNASDATDIGSFDDDMDLAGEFEYRNMSEWVVRIPTVLTEQDSNSRPYPVFIIKIVAFDGEDWEVKRKMSDFYTLQTKMQEFHKKLPEELPTKKGLFSPRGEQYLEGRRKSFEGYLQRMIRYPEFACSDLLFCFLRSPAEFQIALRSPISLYGVLRRSIEPMKIKKERGRHLDHLIAALVSSIDSPHKKECYYEETTTKRDITKSMFGDNLAPVLKAISSSSVPVRPVLKLNNVWDCLLFTAWKLLGCREWFQRLILVVKVAFGEAASPLVHRQINSGICSALIPRLPNLLRLLQGVLLGPSSGKSNSLEEAKKVRQQVLALLTDPSSQLLKKALHLTAPQWNEGITTALDTLQHPTINKHLYYCLFDELLRTLFAEMTAPSKT